MMRYDAPLLNGLRKRMTPAVGFVSLGCPKALVDSEHIITQLKAEGYRIVDDYASANLVVINTCGFIESAIEESLEAISEALQENGKVIVTGCLGADASMIQQRYPQVLAVTGPHALVEVMSAVHQHLPKPHDPFIDLVPPAGIKLTPKHYAYLKISEGCNHRCTFCIIPSMRGDLESYSVADVLTQAQKLKEQGVKELLLIAQDLSAYGVDVRYRSEFYQGAPVKTRLTELCQELAKLGIWVRLHYVYPYPHVDELIPLMAEGLILPYLDMPLQHSVPHLLKAMRRPANSENTLARIAKWRNICPDIVLRSTFIVGFPGETEQDFEALLDFLQEAQLDRVGAFAYSPVSGAVANTLENPVPEAIKLERLERFMLLQAEISAKKLARRVGQTLRVLIDGYDEDGRAIARSYADAPEIDGNVIVDNPPMRAEGNWLEVTVYDSDNYDLYAESIEH